MTKVPLRNRAGELVAEAAVDDVDAELIGRYRWALGAKGYAIATVRDDDGKHTVRLHRLILGLAAGDARQGDHIDGDPLNCQRANLRVVPASGNAQNRRAHRTAGRTSRYRGVAYLRNRKGHKKWVAVCRIDGRFRTIGYFHTETEAAVAAQHARDQHMPYATSRDGGWT